MTERMDRARRTYRLRGQDDEAELSFLLPPGEHRIGSADSNDLTIARPGISRHHACLHHGGEGLTLEDLDSRNGTFVNGRRIRRGELSPGDLLRFGPVEVRLEEIDDDDARLGIVLKPTPQPSLPPIDQTTLSLDESSGHPGPSRELVFPPGYIRGHSPAIMSFYRAMRPLAMSEIPVLIEGETGVGKEMVARALHLSSRRAKGPYIAVNCAAIPADLLEAEMFGIGDGVATGVRKRSGTFRSAHRGTLFLDEIAEMPVVLQAKLLRVLQEKEVQPVGGRPEPVDVRVVTATNIDLRQRVEEERFRPDLYFRVAGSVLPIPPLRERPEDIGLFVEHFLERFATQEAKAIRGMTVKALDAMTRAPWPGNVRQLEHEVQRLVHLCANGAVIDSTMLIDSGETVSDETEDVLAELDFEARIQALETEMILKALEQSRGVQRKAAELLGISRNRLARKLKELDIQDTSE